MTEQLAAPVALIIFNRPDLTARVMEQIALAKPKQLFIIADGPRANKEGEAAKCLESRKMVEHITWPCEVFRNYSNENLGCRERIASGLDWVFGKVDRAIILEDDCIPDQSFFSYCNELLERYKNDTRIGAISGTNMNSTTLDIQASYYFSKYPLVWGWATWARVWQNYDVNIPFWGAVRETNWLSSIVHEEEFDHWQKAFNRVFEHAFDTWDYQLVFSIWHQGQITIQPAVNLISNIGFRDDATHTKNDHWLADMTRNQLQFPLRHPMGFNPNFEADMFYRKENCVRKKKRNPIKKIFSTFKP